MSGSQFKPRPVVSLACDLRISIGREGGNAALAFIASVAGIGGCYGSNGREVGYEAASRDDMPVRTTMREGSISIVGLENVFSHLANRFGLIGWAPTKQAGNLTVQPFLDFYSRWVGQLAAERSVHSGEHVAELAREIDLVLQKELEFRDWLAGLHPTIADLAMWCLLTNEHFPLGSFSRSAIVSAWLARVGTLLAGADNAGRWPESAIGSLTFY